MEDKVDPRIMLALLDVTPEAELQREIRDIIDELDIMLHIVGQQEEVIKRFVRFAEDVLRTNPVKSSGQAAPAAPVDVQNIVADQIKSFEARRADLLSEVEDRIKELEGLKASALSTAENVGVFLFIHLIKLVRLTVSQVNDLLSLKQQQASVVQAYEAMKQGEETVRQGKAIMVFTVMTILFVQGPTVPPFTPNFHTGSKLTDITATTIFHELTFRHERRRAYGLRPVARRR